MTAETFPLAVHGRAVVLPSAWNGSRNPRGVSGWAEVGFMSGAEYGRISAKVAHLSASRLRAEFDDFASAEIRPLAVRCCEALQRFLNILGSPQPSGFAEARRHVDDFLR